MSTMPAMVAGGTIRPFRCVEVSATNTVTECNASTDNVLGVTDGSTEFNVASHATTGNVVRLQDNSQVILAEAGAAIAAGALVMPDTDGQVITATSTNNAFAVALQAAGAAGERVRIARVTKEIVA